MHGSGGQAANATDVEHLIDARPISALQIGALALCCLVATCDGMDSQALALAAPAIAREWALTRADLALVFSAAPVGMLLGGILFGSAADRFGRRPIIIGSTFIFAL